MALFLPMCLVLCSKVRMFEAATVISPSMQSTVRHDAVIQ